MGSQGHFKFGVIAIHVMKCFVYDSATFSIEGQQPQWAYDISFYSRNHSIQSIAPLVKTMTYIMGNVQMFLSNVCNRVNVMVT